MLGRSALLAATNVVDYGNWLGNYNNVSLLLRNGTQPLVPLLVPLDESPSPKALTTVGNAAISTSIKQYGTSSMVFDGSGDYFQTESNSALALGSGDFTVEAWVNPANITAGYRGIIGDNVYISAGGFLFYQNGSAIEIWRGPSLGTRIINATSALTAGTFQHVAWTRQSGVNRCFVDGVQVGSSMSDSTNYTATVLSVGSRIGTSLDFNGYIDDLRITKGVARYTANFTPPTAELPANVTDDPSYNNVSLLLRNGTAALPPLDESPNPKGLEFVGNAGISTTSFKYGNSSLFFNSGTDNRLNVGVQNDPDFDLATNDFTIEAWIYPKESPSNAKLIVTYYAFISSQTQGWGLLQSLLGLQLTIFPNSYSSGWFNIVSASNVLALDEWQHVAVTRSSDVFRLFVNGNQVATNTSTYNLSTYASNLRLYLGSTPAYGLSYNGYIDDLRITKGIARYTSNFAPPPAELPNF